MLFYIRCPSCGRVISTNLDKYHQDLANIQNDPNLSRNEKNEKGSELLNKYGFTEICCRIRIMGLVPYHDIVV